MRSFQGGQRHSIVLIYALIRTLFLIKSSICFQNVYHPRLRTAMWAVTTTSSVVVEEEESAIHWVDNLHCGDAHESKTVNSSSSQKQFSLLSWNILAQSLFDRSRHTVYDHIQGDFSGNMYSWPNRFRHMLTVIEDANADVVCLQEAEFATYQRDILPAMQSLGYEGIVQGDESVKESKRSRTGQHRRAHIVATFWKTARFQPVSDLAYLARARTLTTVLKSEGGLGAEVAVVNCHLEGHPLKSSARVRQLHHTLRDLSIKHPQLNGLVVCGDFNCELQSSACSTYLEFGSCAPPPPPEDDESEDICDVWPFYHNQDINNSDGLGDVCGDAAMLIPGSILEQHDESQSAPAPIMEWGSPVPGYEIEAVPAHPYKLNDMMSAFPPSLGWEDPSTHFTYAAHPGHPVAGLDQIWYSGSSLHQTALRKMFQSEDDRIQILDTGLPNKIIPSDHLPIGCVLEWNVKPDQEEDGISHNNNCNGQQFHMAELAVDVEYDRNYGSGIRDPPFKPSPSNGGNPLKEVDRLVSNCPFENSDQKKEFEFIISDVKGLPEGGKKPSDDQLSQLKERRERKHHMLTTASEKVKQILMQVVKLKKEAVVISLEEEAFATHK